MVGGKLTSPAGFKERSLGQTPQKNHGNDEASLRPDAMVASRPQRQGSGDERSDKNGRTALDAASGSHN